jgi:hypothetical protein
MVYNMRTRQAEPVDMRKELLRRVGALSPTHKSMVEAYVAGDISRLAEMQMEIRRMIRKEDELAIAVGPSIEEVHGCCKF